jgi:transcriptional regulator with XRE-family HTH domain
VSAGAATTSALAEQIGTMLEEARGDTPRRELARELGIAAPILFRIERGKENLTLARLERIAAGYGVELRVDFVPLAPPWPAP